jgi:hypothetical protein
LIYPDWGNPENLLQTMKHKNELHDKAGYIAYIFVGFYKISYKGVILSKE